MKIRWIGEDGMMAPKCSIVIRAFNESKHIGKLLRGIQQQNMIDFEVILVDSGSTDNTREIAESFDVKIVHIDPSEFTFGRSLNRGVQAAKGEFIIMASAHVYPVYPDWLTEMLAPFEDQKVACVYGKQRGNESNKYSEHQFFRQWFPDVSVARQSHPFCNNANSAIRRSLWEENPYDEEVTGLEDLVWAKWLMKKGYFVSYAADAEIVHVHEEVPKQVYNRYRREAMTFKQIYPEEKFTFWNFLTLFLSNSFNDLWHSIREKKFFSVGWSILWFRFMQFWGTFRGYRQPSSVTEKLRKVFYYPPGLQSGDDGMRSVQPISYDEL